MNKLNSKCSVWLSIDHYFKALLGFNYLIHNYGKKNTTLRKKRIVNKRKGIIPQGESTNETKGPMQGAAQVVKKATNYVT